MINKLLIAFLMAAPLAIFAFTPQMARIEKQRKEVQTTQLWAWYSQKKPMIVIDARTKSYFDGRLLPQAIWLPADATEDKIRSIISSKESLVIVYCYSRTCPMSGQLYDKLTSMGYTNVYDYRDGLKDWIGRGLPITKQ